MNYSKQYFENQRIQLVIKHPFFGLLSSYLKEMVVTEGSKNYVAQFGTDGEYLYINQKFVEGMGYQEKMATLAHQVYHICFKHIYEWRRRGRDKYLWNVAADLVINLHLKKDGFQLMPNMILDEQFEGMPVEEVYERIKDDAKKYKLPSLDIIEVERKLKDGKDVAKKMENEWERRVVNAALQARSQNKMTSGVERCVNDLLNPELPWHVILANLASDVLKEDYDETHFDRRFTWQKIYLPDLYSESAEVAVIIDTSGSISEANLKDATTEAFGVLHCRKVSRIRLICADEIVRFDKVVEKFDEFPVSLGDGEGGTDFGPALKLLEEKPPALAIYVTDLDGDFPEKAPNYPLIWIATTNISPPFGGVVRYKTFKNNDHI
jgi:predicted metal-dependent peptidase